MFVESSNKLIKHLINKLRDTNTNSFDFRAIIEEISRGLLFEALNDAQTKSVEINTWQGKISTDLIDESSLVFIPILRAGEPMLAGLLKLLPNARSGFIAMKRNEETAVAELFYESVPNLSGKTVVLLDPMVATGGSLRDAVTLIADKSPAKIVSLNILGTPVGVETVMSSHPNIDMYIAQIDPTLDSNNYIRPGLGDAGDRAFHTH